MRGLLAKIQTEEKIHTGEAESSPSHLCWQSTQFLKMRAAPSNSPPQTSPEKPQL